MVYYCKSCKKELPARHIVEERSHFCSFDCADKYKTVLEIKKSAFLCNRFVANEDYFGRNDEIEQEIFSQFEQLKCLMHNYSISENAVRNILGEENY